MTKPNTFLITYGLHNFVTHAQSGERHIFTIRGRAHPKMVRHAQELIAGCFGSLAHIQTV